MMTSIRETSPRNVSYADLRQLRIDLLIEAVSVRIYDYIEEAVGNVDERVHRLFKDVALRTSLYIVRL